MSRILNILNDGDLCMLPALIVLLLWVGSQMAQQEDWKYAKRVAFAAFLAYCVYGCFVFDPVTAENLFAIAIRGLMAGGLALALSVMVIVPFRRLFRKD